MRKFLFVQGEKTDGKSGLADAATDDLALDALNWLMAESEDANRPNVFEKFPELSRNQMMKKVLSCWPVLSDRGAFRDAVDAIFFDVQDDDRAKALPRIREIFLSNHYSTGARAFAFHILENWGGESPVLQVPPEEMDAINIDFLGDWDFSPHGSVENTSGFLASLMWDPREKEDPYTFVERIRQRAGIPYAFAHYQASLDSAPWQKEILRRLSSTGCLTARYLLGLAFCNACARTRDADHPLSAEIPPRIEAALGACTLGPGPDTARDEWFQYAKFWFSPCDTHGNYIVASWVPTPRPGGNFAFVILGPDGALDGWCDRSVPEDELPSHVLGRMLSPIDAVLALALVRRGFTIWAEDNPPKSINPRRGPGAEFDALLYIEDAAVQMICAHPQSRQEGELEILHPNVAASPAKLAGLLASDAYKSWGRPQGLMNMIALSLNAMDWRADLQQRIVSEIGRDRLVAACLHMAEWHRTREEHVEAATMKAAARDLTPPGPGTVLLEALTDLWANILVPMSDHPFARTAGESLAKLVHLQLDTETEAAEQPLCVGRGDDYRSVFSLVLAMLRTTFENYPKASPSAALGEVASLLTEGTRKSTTREHSGEINSRCSALLREQGLDAGQVKLVLRDVQLALIQRRVRLGEESE